MLKEPRAGGVNPTIAKIPILDDPVPFHDAAGRGRRFDGACTLTAQLICPSFSLSKPPLSPKRYARLKAEAEAPYRGLRRFAYLGLGASASIGAFIFSLQLLAGKDPGALLPNLALQIGLAALMIALFRWDAPKE